MLLKILLVFFMLDALSAAPNTNIHPPPNWILKNKADSNEQITVTLALKQVNKEWLDTTLSSVSDPNSPNYGQHLSLKEISAHVYAHPKSVDAVKKLFHDVGIFPSFTIGQSFAVVKAPVSIMEKLFSAKFYHFEHSLKPGLTTTRTLKYSVPLKLKPHVDFVCCMDRFPNDKEPSTFKSYSRPKSPVGIVTPMSIEKSYNISGYENTNVNNSQAVVAFLKQYFRPSDLTRFQEKFDLSKNPITKVIGKNNEMSPGGEASLDVQYITAVGRNVPTWFISIDTYANNKQEDFLSWLVLLSNTTNSPWVHSASYGDNEEEVDKDYMQRCEDEFKKLGISGRTILFASGDSGVACKKDKFHPNWPASSPSLTTVGGTTTLDEVWPSGGGGFSNVFPMPSYQTDAVQAYLASKFAPSTKLFNPQGRAYPDVSAFALGFMIYVGGEENEVGGTSCAAPTVAGIVSLLNDVRLNKGMSTLGFINPLLYKLKGEGFFDVTKGNNDNYNRLCGGFKAGESWDPASGWGSPNFGILKSIVLQQ